MKEHICDAKLSFFLDNFIRKWTSNPDKILSGIIKGGMVVLDVGCGPGFFTIPIAEKVGKKGKVIAADLQTKMLDKVRKKIKGKDYFSRIKLHKCGPFDIGVKEKVDMVFAFYVFHEIKNKKGFLQEMKSILKPNGIFYFAEPTHHVSSSDFDESVKMIKSFGFKIVKRPKVFLSKALIFRK